MDRKDVLGWPMHQSRVKPATHQTIPKASDNIKMQGESNKPMHWNDGGKWYGASTSKEMEQQDRVSCGASWGMEVGDVFS